MLLLSWKSHLNHQQFKENATNLKKNVLDSTSGWKHRLLGPFLLIHFWGHIEEVETSTGGTAFNLPHLLLIGLCFFHSNSTRFIGFVFYHYLFTFFFVLVPFLSTLFFERSFLAAFFPWFTFYILVLFCMNRAVKPLLSSIKTFFGFD